MLVVFICGSSPHGAVLGADTVLRPLAREPNTWHIDPVPGPRGHEVAPSGTGRDRMHPTGVADSMHPVAPGSPQPAGFPVDKLEGLFVCSRTATVGPRHGTGDLVKWCQSDMRLRNHVD